MRSLHALLFILGLAACGDSGSSDGQPSAAIPQVAPEIRLSAYSRSDTLRFASDSARMMIVGLGQAERLPDSTQRIAVEFSLWQDGKPISLLRDTFGTQGEEELFSYFPCYDTSGKGPERFVDIGFGYPACGYQQQHRVLCTDQGRLELLARYESSADGAYGMGVEFFGLCGTGSTVYSSAFSSEGDEQDEAWMLTAYSDSVEYRHTERGWEAKAVTPKDSVFRRSRIQWM
jgi:hypothetical protein